MSYIKIAKDDRLFAIAELLRRGCDLGYIYGATKIDMFFLDKIQNVVLFESVVKANPGDVEVLKAAKRMGFSDAWIGAQWGMSDIEMYRLREANDVFPCY